MGRLTVWGPKAGKVEAQVGRKRLAMLRGEDGWWQLDSVDVQHGARYGFVVDGEGPFPDPRSASQPDGVLGLSEVVDHSRFQWTDGRWNGPPLSSAIIYELHVGTFTDEGTFGAAAKRLGHLLQLGVTHVELMPVAEFSGLRGWGYDGVDLYAPHRAYGGPEGLKRFVEECHRVGLSVILDVVYNHLGPSGNFLGRFGPYFTSDHHTPWGDAINFDGADSDTVRRFFIDNALMWLRDYHMDGLRLDAIHAMHDSSAVHFLEQLAEATDALGAHLGKRFVLIAESNLNDPRPARSRDAGGFGLSAQWSDDFHHSLHTLLTGERTGYYEDFGSLGDLAKALTDGYVYDGIRSRHRRQIVGHPATGLSGNSFVICAQNHDQVGNRAQGERLTHLVTGEKLRIAAALLLMAPQVPMLFAGEEWGASTPFLYFTDHEDPELAEAVRKGRAAEFAAFLTEGEAVPDPQSLATFERSRLKWEELAQSPHAEILDWYHRLIALRHATPELADGRRPEVKYNQAEGWLTMKRGSMQLVCNFSNSQCTVPISPAGRSRIELYSGEIRLLPDNRVLLGALSVAILS